MSILQRFYVLFPTQTPGKKKENIHLLKHTSIHRRWGGGDIIMTIICSNQKCGTSRAAGRELGLQNHEHKSRLTCVSSVSRLPWEISGNIWLFHPHAPRDAISVAHNTAHILSCTQTHVEHISVANGQWRPNKSPAGNRFSIKSHTTQFRSFNPSRLGPSVVAGVWSSGQSVHQGASVVVWFPALQN